MASIYKMPSGKWRAQVYVRGVRASNTFASKREAVQWAAQFCEKERSKLEAIDRGEPVPEDWEAEVKVVRLRDWQVLNPSDLYERDEILKAAVERQTACGVYFLIQDDEIVYVGQSVNVSARLAQHITDGRTFDRFSVIECEQRALSHLESHYIRRFKPRLNIAGVN